MTKGERLILTSVIVVNIMIYSIVIVLAWDALPRHDPVEEVVLGYFPPATPLAVAEITTTLQTDPPLTAPPTPSFTPTPTLPPSAIACPPPAKWSAYFVQSGDTLFSLARSLNISVEEVQIANCLDDDLVQVGQIIFLPIPTPAPTPTFTPMPRGTPTPTSTPVPVWPTPTPYPAPILLSPWDGSFVHAHLTFRWGWGGRLGPGERFRLKVWMEDERDAALYWTEEREYSLDLSIWPAATYHWRVEVVRGEEVLSGSEAWTLKWYPPPPTSTPTETPTPTPTPTDTPTPTPTPTPTNTPTPTPTPTPVNTPTPTPTPIPPYGGSPTPTPIPLS